MLSKKNIKKTIVLFTFRRKKAEFLLALFLIASLPLAAGEISDTDVLNAVSSTNLISDSKKLTRSRSGDTDTKVTTEVMYKHDGDVGYYYREIYKPTTTNETVDLPPAAIPRKVNIISGSDELPKHPPVKIKPKIKTTARIKAEKTTPKITPYVYKETFSVATTYPDQTAPLLSDEIGVRDSIEPFNRAMFNVDDFLFVYLISPIGKGYNFIIPRYFRSGISRMDYNIEMPKRSLNNLFQAKWKGAGISFSRFLVNSTIGLAGFYDPAKEWFGWEKYDEDFGQTLAVWGVNPGGYFYFPLLGSHTYRDFGGSLVDMAMDPRNALIITPVYGVTVFMKFNNITLRINAIEQLKESYYDTYSLKRDFWYMKRTADIAK